MKIFQSHRVLLMFCITILLIGSFGLLSSRYLNITQASVQLTTTPSNTPYASENLIFNGNFSAGLTGWSQDAISGSVNAGQYCGSVTTPGSHSWDVIFRSTASIALEQGHVYRLSFQASAAKQTSFYAYFLLNQSPWTPYMTQTPVVTSDQKIYTYTYTHTEPTDPAAVLVFHLGGQEPNTYCFDNISVTELITATNTPTATASAPTPVPGPNLLLNGAFDNDKTDWYETGNIVGAVTEGRYCGSVSNPGVNPWDIALGNGAALPLTQGRTYRVSFQASAATITQMRLVVAMDRAPGDIYLDRFVMLSPTLQSFSYTFSMTKPGNAYTYLLFQFGTQAATTYCLDDVALVDVEGLTPTPMITPTYTSSPTASPTSLPTSVGNYGQVVVKQWYQGRKSALSFTFDGGYKSQVTTLLPALNEQHLPSTFFVASDQLGKDELHGNASDFAQVLTAGHEIGSQGFSGNNLTTSNLPLGDSSTPNTLIYELAASQTGLQNTFPAAAPLISFAYPFGAYNNTVRDNVAQYYQAARILGGQANPAIPSNWQMLYSYSTYFGNLAARTSLADDLPELAQTQNWLQNQVFTPDQWGILLFQEVLPQQALAASTTRQPASIEWFTALANWLQPHINNKDVWVATFGNVTRYIKEREALRTWVTAESETQIQIQVTDALPDTLFNHPLTLEIAIPNTWRHVRVQQASGFASTPVVVESISTGGYTSINVDISPTGGMLTLERVNLVYLPNITR